MTKELLKLRELILKKDSHFTTELIDELIEKSIEPKVNQICQDLANVGAKIYTTDFTGATNTQLQEVDEAINSLADKFSANLQRGDERDIQDTFKEVTNLTADEMEQFFHNLSKYFLEIADYTSNFDANAVSSVLKSAAIIMKLRTGN